MTTPTYCKHCTKRIIFVAPEFAPHLGEWATDDTTPIAACPATPTRWGKHEPR